MRAAALLVGALGIVASGIVAPVAPAVDAFDAPVAAVPDERPNVVLVLVDDARYDDLAVLPDVRRLIGTAGATFTSAVSPFPLCCPARATLLTGQYAHNHQVLDNTAPLGGWAKFDDSSTLATWLDPKYTTGLIGKYFNEYRLPYQPPGWDHWMVPKATYAYRNPNWNIDGEATSIPGYQTDTMGRLAGDFITENAPDPEPFFLYTSIVGPHGGNPAEPDDPSFPTPNVADVHRNSFAGTANSDPSFNESDVRDKPLRPSPLTSNEIEELNEVNAQRKEALLSGQDAVVRIVRALTATGELDNTYLFFLSDNGYIIGEHRIRGGKVAPYEVSVKVPMLVRGPGIEPGTVVNQPVGLQDFAPTVLAMTDRTHAQRPFAMDGTNLLPMLSDPTPGAQRPILIEAGPESATETEYRYHGIIALSDGVKWKYVERDSGSRELYDLTNDPYELENVADDPDHAAVQSSMQELLDQYKWCAGQECL